MVQKTCVKILKERALNILNKIIIVTVNPAEKQCSKILLINDMLTFSLVRLFMIQLYK